MLRIVFGGSFFIFYTVQVYVSTLWKGFGYTLTSAFVLTAVVGVSIPGKYLEAWVQDSSYETARSRSCRSPGVDHLVSFSCE